jgi:hypothetical protein
VGILNQIVEKSFAGFPLGMFQVLSMKQRLSAILSLPRQEAKLKNGNSNGNLIMHLFLLWIVVGKVFTNGLSK